MKVVATIYFFILAKTFLMSQLHTKKLEKKMAAFILYNILLYCLLCSQNFSFSINFSIVVENKTKLFAVNGDLGFSFFFFLIFAYYNN